MKAAVNRLYDAANEGGTDIFDELLAPDFVSYGGVSMPDIHGVEAFKEFYGSFLTTFPDLQFQVDDLVAEGDLCASRGTLRGTHKGNFMGMAPPTNKPVEWTGIAIFRFNEDGLMDARWLEMDAVSLMQQLGVIPAQDGSGVKPPAPQLPAVEGGRSPSEEENKALMRRFIEEVWNKGNFAVADELFHPEATSPSAPQLPTGPEGVKVIATMFRNAFPDYWMTIDQLIVEGDRVVARFIQGGTHQGELFGIPATGKQVEFTEIGILRIADGKVVESWYEVDMLGLMQQLGVGGPAGQG
jgi:predicted ester cyclase